jgi:hypothetical protein
VSFGSNGIFYGIVYAANLGNLTGAVVTIGGTATVQGAVIVDGPGGVVAGSSGDSGSGAANIVYDDRSFDNVKGNMGAGIVQNSWRTLPGVSDPWLKPLVPLADESPVRTTRVEEAQVSALSGSGGSSAGCLGPIYRAWNHAAQPWLPTRRLRHQRGLVRALLSSSSPSPCSPRCRARPGPRAVPRPSPVAANLAEEDQSACAACGRRSCWRASMS